MTRHQADDTAPDTAFLRGLRAGSTTFRVRGIPADADPVAAALLRSRLISAADSFLTEYTRAPGSRSGGPLGFTVANGETAPPVPVADQHDGSRGSDPDALSLAERASHFPATDPLHDFDFLVLPQATMDQLLLAVNVIEVRTLVFGTWGLQRIEPHPSSAINLHGPPGTGKTLAAHAIASRLNKKIIQTKYSQLESKYHGEGPKNLDALFHAAREHDAVLFLDEADALMSQRFETTGQGSEHAVNAMRSELVMSLDRYEGLVVFATNLVHSYDTAFDSRVRHIEFPAPDAAARAVIWRNHLPEELPLAADVSPPDLAAIEEVTGRDIRRAVIDAATATALRGRDLVTQADLRNAVEQLKAQRISRPKDGRTTTATPIEPGSPLERAISKAVGDANVSTMDDTAPAAVGD
ncbi:ATP-binding protein [Streptomyces rubiginosohelvolus]|uniref:ATP-binding protein n=1 Tax=Streptomyces rubiginosohelvolus TaxID=67362 RepID=UPI0035DCE716